MANIENYWQHYGMKLDPFSIDTDLEPCYLSLQWQQYIEFLSDLNNYRNALVLLTGLPGVGKTCFMYQLLSDIPSDVVSYVFHARDCHGAEQLLEMLQDKFAIPAEPDFNLNLYDKANQQLTYLQHTGKRYLLLVDHAEALPLDVRQVLVHFVQQQLSGDVALQIILVGEEKLFSEMQHIASGDAEQSGTVHIVNNLVLDPFTQEETAAYIQHRLLTAGFSGNEELFTDEDIDYIYQQSNGVAKKINELATSLLRGYIMEHDNQQQEVRPSVLKRYIWWIAVIAIIAILLIWVLPMFQNNSSTDTKPMSLPVQQESSQDDVQNNDQPTDQSPDQQQVPQQTAATSQQSAQQANPNPDYSQPNNQNLSNPNQNPSQPMATQQATTQQQPVQQQPSQQPVAAQPTATPPVSQAVQPQPVAQPTPAPTPKKAAQHTVKKATMKATAHAKASGSLTPVEGELLKINPNYYTIQLLGSHKKSDIIAFMHQHKLQNEAVYFHTYFNGQDWYVLISGDYATLAQAKAARAKLPASLRNMNPWIRNFASVHKSIKMRP